jgi:hypothetical protein
MNIPELILGFLFGILANLLTPLIDRVIGVRVKQRALQVANKEKADLESEYERIRKLRNNPNLLYATFAGQTLHALSSLFVVILVLSVSFALAVLISIQFNFGLLPYIVVASIGVLFGYTGFRVISGATIDIYRVIDFETYEAKVLSRIDELKTESTNINS